MPSHESRTLQFPWPETISSGVITCYHFLQANIKHEYSISCYAFRMGQPDDGPGGGVNILALGMNDKYCNLKFWLHRKGDALKGMWDWWDDEVGRWIFCRYNPNDGYGHSCEVFEKGWWVLRILRMCLITTLDHYN